MNHWNSKLKPGAGEMRDRDLLIVDWTRGGPRLGVFGASDDRKLSFESSIGSRVVLKHEPTGLSVISGAAAMAIEQTPQTIIFEDSAVAVSRTDESELIGLLVEGFWNSLTEQLSAQKQLTSEQLVTYVVTPQSFSPAVIESLQAAARNHPALKLQGCIQDAAALIIGVLRALPFHQYDTTSSEVTIALLVACDEHGVDIACFDYLPASPTRQTVFIRDCFQTTCRDLAKRLHECDWLGSFSQLIIVEDPNLSAAAGAAIEWTSQAIADAEIIRREILSSASQLRMFGAAHIAVCASGVITDEQEYELATAWNLGLQIDQEYFHPIISKDAWSSASDSSALATQAFGLHGKPATSLRLNFCAGYSRLVTDAVALGHTVLYREELAQLNESSVLTASVSLDGQGGGEFRVGVMPQNRLLRRHEFTLPGLIV